MPPLEPGDLTIRLGWRLDIFAEGVGALFWGAVLFWFAWLAADPGNQFGSWLAPVNNVPVPLRVAAIVVMAGFLSTVGVLAIARSFRPAAAILGKTPFRFQPYSDGEKSPGGTSSGRLSATVAS